MKKIFTILLFNLTFYNIALAESYYFKNCLLNETITADYSINIENKIINVTLKSSDGKIQKVKDKIDLIEKNKIISEKIKSSKSQDSYFIYYLDVTTQSVIKQEYRIKKIGEIKLVQPYGPKNKSYCSEIKADWNQVQKNKILKKEIEEKTKKKKERKEELEKVKLENEKKRKEQENKYNISIDGEKWIKLSKYNYDSKEKNKLISNFDKRAIEICLSNNKKKFTILSKKIEIIEQDDTPAFGTEAVIKIGINGMIECK